MDSTMLKKSSVTAKDKPAPDRLAAMLSFCYTCVCEKHGLDYEVICKPKEESKK